MYLKRQGNVLGPGLHWAPGTKVTIKQNEEQMFNNDVLS